MAQEITFLSTSAQAEETYTAFNDLNGRINALLTK